MENCNCNKRDSIAEELTSEISNSDVMREVCTRFPQFFSANVKGLDIPAGWKDTFIGAMGALQASGLPLKITGLSAQYGKVEIICEDGYSMGEAFLNDLLKGLSSCCPICGGRVHKKKIGNSMNLCQECRKEFMLATDCTEWE